mmetsp:Transcript_15790/g.36359  ORF Transcript_15790/g.36359 Transcript_15790/m.36359 type:complete len:413 (-) Transcript_15790:303-1541(-)
MATESHAEDESKTECGELGCTCREPPVVSFSGNGGDDGHETSRTQFIENLRTLGWSPIIVSDAPNPSPSREEILEIFRRRNEQGDSMGKSNYKDVVYIPSESGSSEGTAEPKESLEVQLSKCSVSRNDGDPQIHDDDEDEDERKVKTFCRTLSWIAHTICRIMLDVPSNAFLPDDPAESLDLLRVFHYYPVPTDVGASSSPTFGSSEHTDWGSLTVVWQDSVGGLQTYCRACKRWNDVRAQEEASTAETTNGHSHCWRCIVHVGDMASLVLDNSTDIDSDSDSDSSNTKGSDTPYPWPSPKHRVVSHSEKERVSLVYFGYPPRGLSLNRIQSFLDDGWKYSSTRGQRLPFKEYYLLRNQSVASTSATAKVGNGHSDISEEDSESGHLYRTMWDLPVQDIVRLKWQQVNRDEQ